MRGKRNPNGLVTIEDLAISSMWEVAALVEVLERKGVLMQQERYATINELQKPVGISGTPPKWGIEGPAFFR